ncbi:MAG: response regulator transcription factor [Parabacteroides sp.]|nr:response regulator transcription factor [Parabacteroides sp.]MDD6081062.1 response regulator transcription factor [bacterium]MCI7008549.1 response regulator transcription factor [Parabacteroides sp.]MCI7781566.1 response regulator transcription factor [Parabacteroides sp.]MDD7061798.1 response regulator transcription factor [bacterium]
MAKILVVEDEANIASFIQRGLREFGHEPVVATDGEQGWLLAESGGFDCLLLDVMMPKLSGLQLCKQFRQRFGYQCPVIMLTALGTTEDIVAGLDAGADDYLVKPFSFLELQARIQAMLRRIGAGSNAAMLRCGDLELDASNHRAIRSGQAIALTVKEYKLLECLMQNAGTAISRAQLLRTVWEKEPDAHNTNVVDVYVNYLRQKVDKTFEQKLIHTVTGVGYRIEA